MAKQLLAGLVLVLVSAGSGAVTTKIDPTTYTIEFDSDYPRCCGIYRGSFTQAAFGAGDYARGFSEFDLSGITNSNLQSASLSFTLDSKSVSSESNPRGGIFSLDYVVNAFWGNNSPKVTDIRDDVSRGVYASINFSTFLPGSVFIVDASQILQNAVWNGANTLGMTIPTLPGSLSTSYPVYFGLKDISLAVVTTSTIIPGVPETSQFLLLLAGLALLGGVTRRRSHRSHRIG